MERNANRAGSLYRRSRRLALDAGRAWRRDRNNKALTSRRIDRILAAVVQRFRAQVVALDAAEILVGPGGDGYAEQQARNVARANLARRMDAARLRWQEYYNRNVAI